MLLTHHNYADYMYVSRGITSQTFSNLKIEKVGLAGVQGLDCWETFCKCLGIFQGQTKDGGYLVPAWVKDKI